MCDRVLERYLTLAYTKNRLLKNLDMVCSLFRLKITSYSKNVTNQHRCVEFR